MASNDIPHATECLHRLIDELSAGCPAEWRDEVEKIVSWLRGLTEDARSIQVLERVRATNGDLVKLIAAAVLLRSAPHRFDGPWFALTITNGQLAEGRQLDVDRLLEAECFVTTQMGVSSGRLEQLQHMKAVRDALQALVDDDPDRTYVNLSPDGKGGFVEQKMKAIAAGMVGVDGTFGPAHPALDVPRGRKGEAALNVLLLMVYQHLRRVAPDAAMSLTIGFVAEGMRLADLETGAADAVEATRSRLRRVRDKKHVYMAHAVAVAGVLTLPIALD